MSQREKVYVVDENDVVLGEKWRDELGESDRWRIIAVWVENSQGDILLQQRSASRTINPNKWTAGVVGTVPLGESYETTAYRELAEEIGVTNVKLAFKCKATYKASVGSRYIYTFSCKVDKPLSEFKFQKEEVSRLRWVTPSQLIQELEDAPEQFTIPELWDKVYGFKFT